MRRNRIWVERRICGKSLKRRWCRTSSDTRSVWRVGKRSRPRIASAILAPTSMWLSKRMRSRTENVGGLPTSCSRTPGRRGSVAPEAVEHHQRVRPHVALGMKLRRLRHALHGFHLGQHLLEESRLVEQFESPPRVAFGEDLDDLVAEALGAGRVSLTREPPDRGNRRRIECKAEARGKAYGAQHTQAVFAEAFQRIADGADAARLDVGESAHVIDDAGLGRTRAFRGWLGRQGIEQQPVDSEV